MTGLWLLKWVPVILQMFFCEGISVPDWKGLSWPPFFSPSAQERSVAETWSMLQKMLVGYEDVQG